MNRTFRRALAVLVPLLLLAGLAAGRIAYPELLENLQFRCFDLFQKMQPRAWHEAPVVIVDIDDKTLEKMGQWPWPRTQVAKLIARLAEDGAAVIATDIVFSEPDRTSPENILKLWPDSAALETLRRAASGWPTHDEALAGAFRETTVVTGFSLTNRESEKQPALKAAFAYSGDDPLVYLPAFRGAVTNLPAIEAAASGNGSFNILSDDDGILRRIPLLFRLKETLYPSLVLEAVRAAQGASNHVVKSSGASSEMSFGEHTGIVSVKTGRYVIPTDAEGRMWLYDSGRIKDRTVPAWKILDKDVNPKLIEGKIVYIGTSAEGLKDLRPTPLDPVMPGVEVQAQLTEQILLGEFLERPDWAPGAELLYAVLLGLFLIILMRWAGAFGCAVLGLLATAGAFHLSWYLFRTYHWLLDPVLPSLEVLVIYLVSSFLNYLRSESEKREIRSAFSRYLSPVLVEELARHPEKLKLGGETKTMTLLFADIRGFTALSERLSAPEVSLFLNRFLTPVSDILMTHTGTIDKYMGDAVMAFWNAPLDDPEHAAHACQAALGIRAFLETFNRDIAKEPALKGKKLGVIRIGIGVNTGSCSVGNMGSDQRFDYSVLGDDVNLTSRLEGLCKIYGVDILIGENTFAGLKDFAVLEVDRIRVKGKSQPSRIYALLGDHKFAGSSEFKKLSGLHGRLLEAYRNREWKEAAGLAAECLRHEIRELSLQNLYLLFESRIKNLSENPPGADWDGITIAEGK
ncbi:MAG: adenylate/guanylate cyclase domain-containing protein [Candidatus Omnitrophota bacterium]|jgi:adenylate cyclase